jgi:hypothetical protein
MRRRLLWMALAAVVVAGLGVAGWYWWQVRFPAREEALRGTPFTLRIQDGVSGREEGFVRRGLLVEQRYLRGRFGKGVAGPVEVRIADGRPCQAFTHPAGTGATGTAQDGFLCVDTRTPSWRTIRVRDAVLARGVSAHELVHVWQAEHGCLPEPDEHTHRWLIEGMAIDLAWRAQIAAGTATRADATRTVRRGLSDARASLGPLRSYERSGGGDPEYALWQLAVGELVDRSGGDPTALGRFCGAIGRGADWHRAFREAFGISVERFYRDFEALRRTLPP